MNQYQRLIDNLTNLNLNNMAASITISLSFATIRNMSFISSTSSLVEKVWWRGACGVTLYQDLVKEGGFESHREADIRAMRAGIESILNLGVALRIYSEKSASWSIPIIIRESGCREKDAKSRESRKTESQRQSR